MTKPPQNPRQWNVGLVGYGEVGRILAEDLRKQNIRVAAYDIKLRSDQAGLALREHARSHGVALTSSFPPSPLARPCRWLRLARAR
jgi:phosphoglycerate dehydrogenase-like enzyme